MDRVSRRQPSLYVLLRARRRQHLTCSSTTLPHPPAEGQSRFFQVAHRICLVRRCHLCRSSSGLLTHTSRRSGAIKMLKDPSTLEKTLTAKSGAAYMEVYPASKFVQLLGAHYWRRNLSDCTVVAVSPGSESASFGVCKY